LTSRNAVSAEKGRNRTLNDECQQPLTSTRISTAVPKYRQHGKHFIRQWTPIGRQRSHDLYLSADLRRSSQIIS